MPFTLDCHWYESINSTAESKVFNITEICIVESSQAVNDSTGCSTMDNGALIK